MSRVRRDGTWIPPRGGANLRCPQCGGMTKVRTSYGGDSQVIRERWCLAEPKHRFLSAENFEGWRKDVSVTKEKPHRIRQRNKVLEGAE
jgi:hypothetical protein